MPEGDSIYQLAKRMQFLVGRQVTACSIRVPQYATWDFRGAHMQRVWPYGKHLFMQLDGHILHTHLKMEGSWAVHLQGDRWRKPGHTARVVMAFDGAPQHPRPIEIVGHSLGFVRIHPAAAYHQVIAELGPDVLSEEWESIGRAQAQKNIEAQPTRPIGTALLDQRLLAGVGNEYRAEICFLAGVHPATPVAQVDIPQVLRITRRLMWENRDSPIRVTTGVRRAGETTYVFGRNHKPCRRCGNPIHQATLGSGNNNDLERIIWWCPQCQPGFSEPTHSKHPAN